MTGDTAVSRTARTPLRRTLNKVPEVTAYFWIVKVLATTVGETAADYLNTTLGFGLTGTSLVMALLLAGALVVQFRLRRYVPWTYWLAVVLISVVGTLVTDNLVTNLGVSLRVTTTLFAVALAATFAAWWATERTLSIHSIVTPRREAFYWLTVLFTFALGTAAGDLVSEDFALGYGSAVVYFAVAIGLVVVARLALGLGAVVAFWAAYVLTRPLGASIGDLLSQSRDDGGLGLGTVVTSALFLIVIAAVVGYLTVTRKDATETRAVGLDEAR